MPDLLQTPRQDVLPGTDRRLVASQELEHRQRHQTVALIATAALASGAIPKRHLAVVHRDDAVVGDRRAEDLGGCGISMRRL